ncbi:MAG TPA: integrin [Gammaproteobacteria bacterium]
MSGSLVHRVAVWLGAALVGFACSPSEPPAEPGAGSATESTIGPAASDPGPTYSSVTYLKASNPGVDDQFGGGGALLGVSLALSGDGDTLAVGARLEDSAATGVDGEQADNSARNAGAVYVYRRRAAGPWTQEAYLKASNTDAADEFGFSLALSDDGNTLAVSSYLEDSAATGIGGDESDNSMPDSGAVYIFVRDAAGWSQQAYVKPSNTGEPEDGDAFGYSLSLSGDGDTLVVGTMGEDSAATGVDGDGTDNRAPGAGAAYVFARDGTTWAQQAYLKASNIEAADLFGTSVSLSDDGDTLAVGALDEDGSATGVNGADDNAAAGSGAVYLFRRNDEAWSQEAYIKASNTERNDALSIVALSGDGKTLAVAAIDEDSLATGVNADQSEPHDSDLSVGAVYIYVFDGVEWSQQAYLKASNTGRNDQFGVRLALSVSGDVLVVGTPLEDGGGIGPDGPQDDSVEDTGAVYLFRRTGTEWLEAAYWKAPNAEPYDEFGATVALSSDGRALAVGARVEDGGAAGVGGNEHDNSVRDAGAVYAYR